MIKITLKLMEAVMTELNKTSSKHCQILNHIVSHVLMISAENFRRVSTEECYKSMFETIDQWRQKVICHPKFGGAELKQFDDEIRVRL